MAPTLESQHHDETHVFLTRLFGLTAAGFGLFLFNWFGKATSRETRTGILRILLFGDVLHCYALYARKGEPHILFTAQFFATASLALARLVYFAPLSMLPKASSPTTRGARIRRVRTKST